MGVGESELRDEVAFWRGLVKEWEQREGLVLTRMRDALAYAELKLELFLVRQRLPSATKGKTHRQPLQ